MTQHAPTSVSLFGLAVQQWQEVSPQPKHVAIGATVRLTFSRTSGSSVSAETVARLRFRGGEDLITSLTPANRFANARWPPGIGPIGIDAATPRDVAGAPVRPPLLTGPSFGLAFALGLAAIGGGLLRVPDLPIELCDLSRVVVTGALSAPTGDAGSPRIDPVGGIEAKLQQVRGDVRLFDALVVSERQGDEVEKRLRVMRKAPRLRETGDSRSYYTTVEGCELLVIRAADVPDAIGQLSRAQTFALVAL